MSRRGSPTRPVPFYVSHDVGDIWRDPEGLEWTVRHVYRDGSILLSPALCVRSVRYEVSGWPSDFARDGWECTSSALTDARREWAGKARESVAPSGELR